VLGHTGHEEGDDDLSRDIELEGVGEEDADGVQQLDRLVQPAIGQVEGYTPLDISSKLQVPQTPQTDVEGSDDGHSHVQDDWKFLGILHFVFKGQNL